MANTYHVKYHGISCQMYVYLSCPQTQRCQSGRRGLTPHPVRKYFKTILSYHPRYYRHCPVLHDQTFGRDPKRRVRGLITVSSMNSDRIV